MLHACYCRQLPTSLEELLEYQWEQGAQFLMQQASQYDGTLEFEFSITIIIHLLLDSLRRSTLDCANLVRELVGVCDGSSDKTRARN